ncbi:HET-domain-containing protein [Canariomyces notabilis]|uniref:HET-domain-containing protein n=1 Tax=Canariomyces notabilis TaxID=2074819 RepID=A0AAN6YVK2_9PEZI|nr:HET-domain-containing protein [Canariomyces arenarius]
MDIEKIKRVVLQQRVAQEAAYYTTPTASPYSFQSPHTCQHCSIVVLHAAGVEGGVDNDKEVDYNASWTESLGNVVEAFLAECELYRWLLQRISLLFTERRANDNFVIKDEIEDLDQVRFLMEGSWSPSSPSQHCVLICKVYTLKDKQGLIGSIPVWTTGADPAAKYISARPYMHEFLSAQSASFAKQCIRLCMDRHSYCRTDQIDLLYVPRYPETTLPPERVDRKDIPKRLLDVGEGDTSIIRLVETNNHADVVEDISAGGFMALSYCWGADQPVKLLRRNHESLLERIDVSTLPQTLQDAIWVARATGFRYLWVDALCILQDDDDGQGNNYDKAIEITRMSSYYGRATVTLCAASARTCMDGFLVSQHSSAPGFKFGPIRIQLRSHDNLEDLGSAYLVIESEPPPEPTTMRGWTMQESLLSRRIIIFAGRQLLWSCVNSFGACTGSHNDEHSLVDRMVPGGVHTLVEGIYPVGCLVERPTVNQWQIIVEEYTTRTLGRGSDKLLAISSIAAHMVSVGRRRNEPVCYAAGLLVNTSVRLQWLHQLLWYPATFRLPRRPTPYRAPTWSWASVDGPVLMNALSGMYGLDAKKLEDMLFAVVDSWAVDLAEPAAPFGALTGGYLTLTASTRSMREVRATPRIQVICSDAAWSEDIEFNPSDIWRTPLWQAELQEGKDWVLEMMPDTSDDREIIQSYIADGKDQHVWLVGLATDGGIRGLVVEEISGGSCARRGSFILAGVLRLRDKGGWRALPQFFAEAEKKTIRIV